MSKVKANLRAYAGCLPLLADTILKATPNTRPSFTLTPPLPPEIDIDTELSDRMNYIRAGKTLAGNRKQRRANNGD